MITKNDINWWDLVDWNLPNQVIAWQTGTSKVNVFKVRKTHNKPVATFELVQSKNKPRTLRKLIIK